MRGPIDKTSITTEIVATDLCKLGKLFQTEIKWNSKNFSPTEKQFLRYLITNSRGSNYDLVMKLQRAKIETDEILTDCAFWYNSFYKIEDSRFGILL